MWLVVVSGAPRLTAAAAAVALLHATIVKQPMKTMSVSAENPGHERACARAFFAARDDKPSK